MEKQLDFFILFISNIFFFFLCSTKWNAGYNICLGLILVSILLLRFRKKRRLVFFPPLFFAGYFLFEAGLQLAAWVAKDPATFRSAHRFLTVSYPLWGCYFLLQSAPVILEAVQWGIVAGTSVLNYVVLCELLKNQSLGRIHGSFSSPNNFAMVLEIILPFLILNTIQLVLHFRESDSPREKILTILSVITALLAVAGILLSQSRGGIAGFLIGGIAVFADFLSKRKPIADGKRYALLGGVFVLSAAIVFGLTTSYFKRKYDPERILLLKSAYHMWQDHKLFGVGLGRWNVEYRARYILPGAKEPTLTLPHNNIANFFSGAGIVGGGGFVVFMFSSLYLLFRSLHTQHDNHYIYAMLWVWLAISVHGMVDNTLFGRYNNRLFFAMWGVTLAAIRQRESWLPENISKIMPLKKDRSKK
jgi:hypothetical protein